MNHFQAILPQVRNLLSGQQHQQVQALLDGLLGAELLSREYHSALLREQDGEALARKISLSLLEKGDLNGASWGRIRSKLQAVMSDRGLDHQHYKGSVQPGIMEVGLPEGGYLELLNSDTDPLRLYHAYNQMDFTGEEEIELCSEADPDSINCDHFTRLLCDVEEDEEAGEAYANIAELDQYVFQDSQMEGLSKDIFIEHIGLDEGIGESVEVPAEAGKQSQKRSLPEEYPLDPKRRTPAETPALPILTGSFLVGPVGSDSTLLCPPPALLSQEPVPGQALWQGAAQLSALPSGSSVNCLSFSTGPFQFISTIPALPQGHWQISEAGTNISGIFIYHGDIPQASKVFPSIGPPGHSLPKSPDRPGSTSPFAPSTADLPSLPEAALTSRASVTEDVSASSCQGAPGVSVQLPKWPEPVEQFLCSLRDTYRAEAAGLESLMVEVDLVQARLEKGSNKSQERELATLDWAERQPARGGLAEVLLSTSDRCQSRETQVIAVLGKAGMGKSHWAREVSRAWACGRLPRYDFVFCVPCHCLDRPGDTYRLQDLLCPAGLSSQALDDRVLSHIVRRASHVLLILDGFEELEAQDGFMHSVCGPVSSEPCSLRGLLAGLFQGKLLRGCTLVLTALPRSRLAQCLSKADALFELPGFSAEQAQTYLRHYLEDTEVTEDQERALVLLRDQPFLLSHGHNPAMCQAVCQLSKALLQKGTEAQLPCTLTGLYVGLVGPAARESPPGALAGLAKLAWELGCRHQRSLQEDQFPSAEVRTWAVTWGLVQAVPGAAEPELAFASFPLHCFLGALWLAQSSEVKDKELPQYLALTPRKKRPYDNWLASTPRFLAGLVFQPRACGLGALLGSAVAAGVDKKRKVLMRYLKRLQPRILPAVRVLELLHCAHETQDPGIWQHVLHGLPENLSFLGTRLTPPDAHVLGRALEGAGRDFSLDLRSTGLDPAGLGSLVGLCCVTRFRASLSDTTRLWESLQQQGETLLLRAAKEKFTIEPFKAKSLKDVEDLSHLVQTQSVTSCSEDSVRNLPAVQDLKKLEFALGPVLGAQAFPKLARILPAFSSLQHLDLDSLSENKIGDEGVAQLSATFPMLKALETLNLSQNSITDVGACQLAEALPSLAATLLRLSLYNNCICDKGAESLAHVLPDMGFLRVMDVQYNKFTAAGAQQLAASLRKCPHLDTLAMWTPTIPFGVQEHLQQLDSRISLR